MRTFSCMYLIICLCQVDYVEPSQNTISLKMIPRIDLDRIKARMSMVSYVIIMIMYHDAFMLL